MSRVGLVLGAGGPFGWDWIVGSLAALRERSGFDGRTADQTIGTSVGSMVGAYLAHGTDLDRLAAHVGGVPDPLDLDHTVAPVAPLSPAVVGPLVVGVRRAVGTVVGHLVRRRGLEPSGLGAEVARRVGTTAWPDTDLTIVAWNRSTRTRLELDRSGPVSLPVAIDGSTAVPGAMPPVPFDGDELVDGGVPSMTNADLLRDDLDVVVVIAPLVLGSGSVGASGARVVRLVHRWTLASELTGHRRLGVPILLLAPSADGLERLRRADRVDRVAQARAEASQLLTSPSNGAVLAALDRHRSAS
ncbi:MAG: patatin-like phospholipase family protein [Actinomycetota bacterium]